MSLHPDVIDRINQEIADKIKSLADFRAEIADLTKKVGNRKTKNYGICNFTYWMLF
jgi:uncharacterized coiled-coil protein SlyX